MARGYRVLIFIALVVGSSLAVDRVSNSGWWLYIPYLFAVVGALGWSAQWVAAFSREASDDPRIRSAWTAVTMVAMGFVVLPLLFAVGLRAADRLGSPVATTDGYCTLSAETPHSVFDYWYVAFITVTTVGYGSLAPTGPQAKALICVEVVVFWVFLTCIALLVQRLFEARAETQDDSTARAAPGRPS